MSSRNADMIFVLDSLYVGSHTACLDPANDLYLPDIQRNRHAELEGVNSQTCDPLSHENALCPQR